jgi:hypothetical protein
VTHQAWNNKIFAFLKLFGGSSHTKPHFNILMTATESQLTLELDSPNLKYNNQTSPLPPLLAEIPPQLVNSPVEVVHLLHRSAVNKANLTLPKLMYSAFLAGIFVTFGGFLALTAAGGLKQEFRAEYPAVPKVIYLPDLFAAEPFRSYSYLFKS